MHDVYQGKMYMSYIRGKEQALGEKVCMSYMGERGLYQEM